MFDEGAQGRLFEGAFCGFEVWGQGGLNIIIFELDGDGVDDVVGDGDGVSSQDGVAVECFSLVASQLECRPEFGEIFFEISGGEERLEGFVLLEGLGIVCDEGRLRGMSGVIDVVGEWFCEVDETVFEVSHLSGEGSGVPEEVDESFSEFTGELHEAFSVDGDIEGGEVRAVGGGHDGVGVAVVFESDAKLSSFFDASAAIGRFGLDEGLGGSNLEVPYEVGMNGFTVVILPGVTEVMEGEINVFMICAGVMDDDLDLSVAVFVDFWGYFGQAWVIFFFGGKGLSGGAGAEGASQGQHKKMEAVFHGGPDMRCWMDFKSPPLSCADASIRGGGPLFASLGNGRKDAQYASRTICPKGAEGCGAMRGACQRGRVQKNLTFDGMNFLEGVRSFET